MSNPVPFSHLHVHTEYSLLDGACRVDKLVERVKELGMESIAVTDHGVMTGLYKLQAAANKAGIKSIKGCELYFTEDRAVKDNSNRYYHLTALAETTQGLHNLYKMNLRAAQEGMYYGKPRVDYELLKEYGEGVIILSGCLAGRTMQSLANSDLEADPKQRMHNARDELIRISDCVGKDNLYVEVQNSGVKEWDSSQWEWNGQLQTLANDLGLLTVGTSDTHYLTADEAKGPKVGDPWYHDTLLCVQTRALKDQPLDKRMSLIHDWNNPHYYHLRNLQEMQRDLENVPESIPNTLIVADRCNAEIKTGRTFEMLPDFPVPEEYKPPAGQPEMMEEKIWRQQSYLREKIWEGLHRRYGAPLPAEVVERAEYELEVINKMGTTSYFLITWDWIRYAKEIGMVIGPGRGCFVPETRIWTSEGYKRIADMKAGDIILDEKGNLGKVRKQFEYQVDEEMVHIKHYYGDKDGLKVTNDHKILVEKGVGEEGAWQKPSGNLQWIPAKEVQPGDLVAVAIPQDHSSIELTERIINLAGDDAEGLLEKIMQGSHSLQTSSEEIAYCARTLMWQMGIPSSLNKNEDNTYSVTGGESDQAEGQLCALVEGHMLMRVYGVDRVQYKGPVYDLAIEDPNPPSYTTSSCIVHNSGAGSIVLYALDVTQLCPLEHKLLFERFLSPDRISMPDVDTDAAPVGEANYDMVRAYLRNKYGEENCAQIITFQTIGGKAGIRSAARAFGPELLPLADRMSKAVPMDGAVPVSLTQALEEGVEFKQALTGGGAEAQKIVDNALWMEGLISAESVHAAAFVISPIPLTDALPIQLNKDGHPVTSFAMGEAESVGCLKLDLLGLRNLSILADAQRLIKKYHDIDVDVTNYQIPMDDAKTYEMLARGESVGVFQFESSGMQDTLRTVGTTEFNDLVAIVAAYRPGAMEQIPLYARRKKGLEPVTYGDERMREILHETYGLCLAGDSMLIDARTGMRIRLDEAVANKTPLLVQGVDENHQPQLAEVTDYFDNGIKPVYKVNLRNGSSITMTKEHRMLTESGWKELQDLVTGDFVACPKEIIREDAPTRWSRNRIRTLAYLLGDGALSSQSLVSFYSSDKDMLDEFTKAATTEFKDIAITAYDRPRGVTGLAAARKERKAGPHYHDASSLLAWLRELGLKYKKGGCRSEYKFIPAEVFQMPIEDIAFFVASLWDCDGYVGEGTSFYKTISPQLAEGLQTLLLMLGISNSTYTNNYTNEGGSEQTAHQVSVHNGVRFAELVQPHMAHKRKLKVNCKHNSHGVSIDRATYISELRDAAADIGISLNKLERETGAKVKNHIYLSKDYGRISQRIVAPVLDYLDMPVSSKNSANNWSEIISIEEAGEQHVYDITVDEIHSYIANNIYVHNCLYQEQSMLLSRDLAGFTGGLMDTLRKAIGKKLMDKMMELKPIFFNGTTIEQNGETIVVPGCIKNGVDKKTTEWVWSVFEASASYSFNKCLSADTKVRLADGRRMRVSEVYALQPKEIMSMWPDGEIRPHKVKRIVKTGNKPLYRVITEGGKRIKITMEHRLLTTEGYLPLSDMKVGTELITVPVFTDEDRAARSARMTEIASRPERKEQDKRAAERMRNYQAGRSMEEKVAHMKRMHEEHPDLTTNGTKAMHEKIRWLRENDPAWVKMHAENSLTAVRATYDTGPGFGHCSIASNDMWCASNNERNMCEWLISCGMDFEMHKVLPNGRITDFYFEGIYWEMDGMDRTHEFFQAKYGDLPFVVVTPEDYKAVVSKKIGLEHAENGDPIVSIEPIGNGSTFDIEMERGGPLNFIANNIVSHNSHAAAYALISYVTAYLKANYPTEYMAALLTSVMHTKDKVPFYLYETKRMGIEVLPPSVNESFSQFEPSGDNAIRFGLTAVKGVGEGIVESVVAARELNGHFKGLWDFCERVDGVNRREVDNLIKAGAFDFSGDTRKGMLDVSESMLKQAKKTRIKKSEGQDSLFDSLGSAEAELAAMQVSDAPSVSGEEFSETERFAMEREVTGLYVSGHPLESARAAWERVRHLGVGEISEEHLSDNPDMPAVITVAGIITAKRAVYTKRDNKRMLIVQLEDLTGTAEIVVFPKLVEQGMEEYLNEGQMAYIRVALEEDTGGFSRGDDDDDDTAKKVKLLARLAGPFNPEAIEVPDFYDIQIPKSSLNAEVMNTLLATLKRYPGEQAVRILLLDDDGEQESSYIFPAEIKVSPSEGLGDALRDALGL